MGYKVLIDRSENEKDKSKGNTHQKGANGWRGGIKEIRKSGKGGR